MQGDYFIPEPVGRIIKRGKVINRNGKIFIEDVYKQQDWLASADMNFRPINTYTGPDGCFYIVDMYHGIIQESEWTKPDSYLGKIIAQKGLYKNRGMGRIYRIVHDGYKRDSTRPDMLTAPAGKLVTYLDHPNGWWRDNAQREIIVRNDQSVVPVLKQIAFGQKASLTKSPGPLARIHALWTLEGLDAIDKNTLFSAFKDADPQVRKAAVWISEMYIKKNDAEVINKLASLKDDPSPDVRIQLSLSLRTNTTNQAQSIVKDLLAANPNNQLMQYSYTTFTESQRRLLEEQERTKNLSPADLKLVTAGATIFKQLCSNCHGTDGKGIVMAGKPMPAPPLAGSPRVKGDKTALIQLVMYGLKGPVDGKTYPDMMPSMVSQNDEWIASVLSYIRNSGELGNKASVVTPEEVKQVRATTPKMKEAFTLQLLEIFKLGRAEKKNWGDNGKK